MKKKQSRVEALGLSRTSTYEEIRQALIGKNFVVAFLFAGSKKYSQKLDSEKIGVIKLTEAQATEEQEKLDFLLDTIYKHVVVGGEDLNDILIARKKGVETQAPGVYIRYQPSMTKRDWLEKLEKAKKIAEDMEIYLDNEKLQKGRKQVGIKDIDQNIEIYLKLESKINRYWHEHRKRPKKHIATGEFINIPIMEASLGKLLDEEKIVDDKTYEQLRERYRNIYYEVAKRYMLPTFSEIPKYLDIVGAVLS